MAPGDGHMHMKLDQTLMALLLLTSSGASQDSPPSNCTNSTFPVNMSGTQCFGLSQVFAAKSLSECRQSCCASSTCSVYEWCPPASTSCTPAASCWIGALHNNCELSAQWITRAKAKSTIYIIGTNADAVGPPFGGLGGLCSLASIQKSAETFATEWSERNYVVRNIKRSVN